MYFNECAYNNTYVYSGFTNKIIYYKTFSTNVFIICTDELSFFIFYLKADDALKKTV